MHRVLVVVIVVLGLAAAVPARGQTPPQTPARDAAGPRKTGSAVVRGRVIAADNGQPLRKAQVRISSPELRESRVSTTGTDGKYEFKELPAGRYSLSVSKGSYVTLSYGQTRPFESGKPLEIQDAQTMEKVDFALPRGSIVTGRIVDEFGEPATDVMVMLQRFSYVGGRRRLVGAGRSASTNDIGEFRLFAIPPGQYYLTATMRSFNGSFDTSDDRSGYAPTYFPGTPNIAEAQRVTLAVGQTLTDLNMSLIPTKLARISGIAVDSQGRAIGGMVMPRLKSDDMSGFNFLPPAQIRPDGTFIINGVSAGAYTLQASFRMGANDGESASVDVTVNGEDVSDVRLVGSKRLTVTGRFIVDAAIASALQPAAIQVMLMAPPNESGVSMGGGMGTVHDDLTFEAKTQPGVMRLSVSSLPTGWGMRAVRYKGVDVIDSGIDFHPNEDVSDIEVELTNHMPEVSGQVTNARGNVVKDYTVVLFPEDRDKWTASNARYLRSGRPDQDGRFKLTGLPAGRFYVVALDQVEQGEWMDPDFLERARSKASTISVGDGETKSIDLRVVASAQM